ncbi:MAG: DUF3793 family protein [Pseudobutyrivibrio sp.]|nr:DUF3793 family protein [Pseudobutyrivibrio sp.]
MSEEVFEMLCAMDRQRIELQIVLQCAPTIAGYKTSNLLIVPREQEDKVRYVLRHSGLLGYRLVYDRQRVIFLVFNRDMLTGYLAQPEVKAFLTGYGYRADSFGYCLRHFQERYDAFVSNRKEFPHEMGAFLGYPLCDVIGFIENCGDKFKASGYWKVYDNVEETTSLFELFESTKDEMILKLSDGYTVKQIIGEFKNKSRMNAAV